jgi:hypothetical protein
MVLEGVRALDVLREFPPGDSARHMEGCHAGRRCMVQTMALRQIRDRILSGCASHIVAEAVSAIVTDENSADFREVHRAAAWL